MVLQVSASTPALQTTAVQTMCRQVRGNLSLFLLCSRGVTSPDPTHSSQADHLAQGMLVSLKALSGASLVSFLSRYLPTKERTQVVFSPPASSLSTNLPLLSITGRTPLDDGALLLALCFFIFALTQAARFSASWPRAPGWIVTVWRYRGGGFTRTLRTSSLYHLEGGWGVGGRTREKKTNKGRQEGRKEERGRREGV